VEHGRAVLRVGCFVAETRDRTEARQDDRGNADGDGKRLEELRDTDDFFSCEDGSIDDAVPRLIDEEIKKLHVKHGVAAKTKNK
jgi:hypothetical protein